MSGLTLDLIRNCLEGGVQAVLATCVRPTRRWDGLIAAATFGGAFPGGASLSPMLRHA